MTQTAGAAADAAPLLGRGVRALRAVAIASCLPYITLKILWIAGNRTGIPDGSTLLDQRVRTALANGASVVLDAAVVVLALLLTRPWGRRVPAWLLVLPMWVAAGLLAPIMIGYPLQLAASVGDGSRPAPSNSEPFLDAWVFGVVYSGVILQGLSLGALFVRYARRRWGHLWQGVVGDLPTTAAIRATVAAGSLPALLPAVMHLLWAAGATTGLSADRIDSRSTDFYLVEGRQQPVRRRRGSGHAAARPPVPHGRPAVAAGAARDGVGGVGDARPLGRLPLPRHGAARRSGPAGRRLMVLTYAVSMVAGILLFSGVVSVLRSRAA